MSCRKCGTKNCIFLKRGSFGAAQVEKVEALGAAKAEKRGAFARQIPVLSLYGSTPQQPLSGAFISNIIPYFEE